MVRGPAASSGRITAMAVHRHAPRILTLVALPLLVGCAGGVPGAGTSSSIALGEFSNPSHQARARSDAATVEEAIVAAGLHPVQRETSPSIVEEALDEVLNVKMRPGQTVVVDSLIGQVNGRPIFADEILAPIMDQLNAEYTRQAWPRFQQMVIRLVSQQLKSVLYNELFLAEARATMTEQQQTGFLAWMNNFRGEEIGRRGGVQAEANRQLLAEEGKTIDEFMKQQEEQQLIQHLMNQRVKPNTLVAWRDVQRAWDARQDEYNPKSTVTLGRIRVRTEDNAEQIKLINDELKAGEPFSVVAASAGMPDDGVWQTFDLGPGGVGDIEIADFYKEHLSSLEVGQSSPSFERGTRTIWISIVAIDKPEGHTLFEPAIQRALYSEIYSRRLSEAQAEFIDGILQRGIYDDIDKMEEKIVAIALSRFSPRR
jgi:hypothetical protein